MKTKLIYRIAISCLIVLAGERVCGADKDCALQIHLPREITITSDTASLGQVSIIRGEQSLAARAGDIKLGQFSAPGQKVIVDRSMVLSRLACSGISGSEVILTGAERTIVKQRQQIIKGDEFVKSALSFLEKKHPGESVCEFKTIRVPKDMVVCDNNRDIKFSVSPVGSEAKNQAKVKVTAMSQGQELGVREVAFRLKYKCRQAVAKIDIAKGVVIKPENVKIEQIVSNYPESAGWKEPYGLVTRRKLAAGTVIRPGMAGPLEPPVVVKRNRNVIIRIDRNGLVVTATGKTMQQGRAGDYIKVRNIDSQRIILAKVNEDGTVEPVF